jgi:D-beta-D-heptose 7-phosphate kinase/D-beta-D-heptose 1-phosphate adenosyltransferase
MNTVSSNRIVTEEKLLQHVRNCNNHNEKIVMTNGCFDLLHPGHVAYLEQAKALGDRLVVAVNDDDSVRRLKGENRPVNDVYHRMAVLAGLRSVGWVVSFSEDTPARLISEVKPQILVKGGDYTADQVAGADIVIKEGGSVKILDFIEGCSTSSIFENIQANQITKD